MQSPIFKLHFAKDDCFRVLRRIKFVDAISKRNCRNERVKSFSEIPGPKPLPIIGNAWRYFPLVGQYDMQKQHVTYQKMYAEYGNLVKETMFRGKEIVHVFSQKDIANIYRNEGPMPLHDCHQAIMKYRRRRFSVYNRAGLLPTNGEEWLIFRRLFNDVLLSPENAESCSSAFEDVIDDLMFLLQRSFLFEKDLQPDLFKWALENFGVVALDRRLGCLAHGGIFGLARDENKEVNNLVKKAKDVHEGLYQVETGFPLWQYFKTPGYRKLASAQDYVAAVVNKYMEGAMEMLKYNKDDSTVLAKMLAVPGAEKNLVFTMIMDMFLAGINTSAYTTGFALYNLARNHPVQNKLRDELMTHLPEKTSRLNGIEMRIPYLRGVLNESLRLNPVSIGRRRVLTSDMVLSGYDVPAGTLVLLQHQVASRLHENFSYRNAFLPDRWIEGSEYYENYDETKPCLHAPFGAGARMCMGKEFAERQMLLLLAKLVRNFKIDYYYGAYGDIESCSRLINVPNKLLRLSFFPTSN